MYLRLAKLLLVLLVMHSCTTGMRFTVTLDALAHGADTFEVGAMLACVSLFPAFFAVAAGRWLDRRGPRPSLTAAVFCASAAGVGTLLLPTDSAGLAPLFAACLLAGTSFLLINTVVQRLTGDVALPEKRALAFTILSVVTATSNLATPVVAGYLIEHFGFFAFYGWVAASPLAAGLVCLMPFMREVLPGAPKKKEQAQANNGKKARVTDFFKDPALFAVMGCSVVVSVAWEAGNLLIPVYCTAADLTPSSIGWVLGSFSAATFVVRLLMPYLMAHMQEWTMIAATLLTAALAFLLFPFFDNFYALAACAFLLGLGLGASLPNMMSLVYRLAPAGRTGEVIGLRLMMINGSKAFFPMALGALGTVIGVGATLWGLSVFVFAGFLFAVKSTQAVTQAVASKDLHAK